jgi:serine/threonine-protein kinase RsbW
MTAIRLCVRRAPLEPGEGAGTAVTVRLPSDVDCIEEAVALLTYHCTAGDAGRGRLRFRLQIVLAEAIANAILRGNREDSGKSVDVRAVLLAEEVRLHVTDQGPGFDPRQVPESLEPGHLEEPNGRGLFLMRHLADGVDFNPEGNSVCITLRRR